MTSSDQTFASPDRRTFLKAAGAAALASAVPMSAAPQTPPVRFGLDMFSVGAQNWTPFQQMDFAAKWKIKMVHFSEIRFLGAAGLDPANLKSIRARADELNLDIEVGMRAIGPTSGSFDKAAGTAEEQITKMLDAAKILRSPIVRCFQGTGADRRGDGGIDRHIDATVKMLRGMRSRIVDSGLKLAIENHAGDMQARELKRLIDESGPDAVGVCIDSGNAVWTIEDPHLTLETLAPYVLTSHVRDSAVWKTPEGAIATRWTRMGEGNVGIDTYIRNYVKQCPGKAVSLEVIVSGNPRIFNPADPAAWAIYRTTPAWEYARFVALADKGKPTPAAPPDSGSTPQSRNLADVEASIQWTQAFLAKM